MTKYHVSSKGYLSACEAETRPCPKGGMHYSEKEYAELAANNDPLVESRDIKAPADSAYAKAREEYESAMQRVAADREIAQQVEQYKNEKFEEQNISLATLNGLNQKKDTALKLAAVRLREIYTEEGVHPIKAGYIVEDVLKNAKDGKLTPVVRNKDKFDSELGAKTRKAKERAATDEKFIEEQTRAIELDKKDKEASKIILEGADLRRKLQAQYAAKTGNSSLGLYSASIGSAREEFASAIRRKNAGVPIEAIAKTAKDVKAEDFSTQNGKINNAWVEHKDGSVERIVSWDTGGKTYGEAGPALITESGKRVSNSTHYHSYRTHYTGPKAILLTGKQGKALKVENFTITTSIDSGD